MVARASIQAKRSPRWMTQQPRAASLEARSSPASIARRSVRVLHPRAVAATLSLMIAGS